jgi:tyrosinase
MSMPDEAFTYGDVQDALRVAAGASKVDYGGLGPFWELPLHGFIETRLMGLPLVDPARSCCGTAIAGAGRGARSTLVRGLRGEAPFDGTQFARLPWGGAAVPAAVIDRIEMWVDEGCPGEGSIEIAVAAELVVPAAGRAEVRGPAGPAFAATADPEDYRHRKGELRQRMDIDAMSDSQVERLRCAFRESYDLNKWVGDIRNYNNVALIHQNHCQHGWERFLTWHRVYLYEFEQVLQDLCPGVTMPYWDFSHPSYSDDPPNGKIIPDAFKCFLTEASLALLSDAGFQSSVLDQLREGVLGNLYVQPSQFFAAVDSATGGDTYSKGEYRNRLIDALLAANSLWYPLRYPAQYEDASGHPLTINSAMAMHYPKPEDIEEILSLRTFRDFGGGSLYDDSFGFLDQNPHNTMHIWTGGMNPLWPLDPPANPDLRNRAVRVSGRRFHKREDLYSQPQYGDMFSNLTASYDPIFWPIHANIDRLWWKWQERNPAGAPADLDAVLTPWSYAARDTLDMHRFGYEYVRASTVIPVGMDSPVGRFASMPLPIPDAVRNRFRSAEVRLHRVPQLERSCFIRVFLNVPDADAATPLNHEGYAGYAAVFGHGECYGGPGHCELPPDSARKYDLRPRSMNTPRNHRIDVSKAARRLLVAGATELTVTLVVIGAGEEEDRELLRLDGVSLNFLD